jgi:hypothetical protein
MKRNLIRISTLLFIWSVFTFSSFGQEWNVDAGYRGSRYSFREYRPKTIRQLDEIPPPVLSRLITHLKGRLGERFYSKLKFGWGEVINLDELYRIEPYWKQERVGSYDLVFYFSDRRKGLKAFHSKIVLDGDGSVIDEINLPDIANQPQKANLISVDEAMRIAARNNFVGSKIWPSFEYNAETDSFAWVIHDSEPVTQKGICPSENIPIGHGPYRIISIEAHTGRILKKDCYSFLV